jgi:hypothetical protein
MHYQNEDEYWPNGTLRKRLYLLGDTAPETRLEGGTLTEYYREDGTKLVRWYRFNGRIHREDGPAEINYRSDGSIYCEAYHKNGLIHREDGPAIIFIDEYGIPYDLGFRLQGVELPFWDFYSQASTEVQKILLKDWLPFP